MGEIFESATQSSGDLAGVFEHDGETGYFYLYETKSGEGQKVVGAIHILTGTPDFEEADIAVRWNRTETAVGLFIRGNLWAAFDCHSGAKHGGGYRPNFKTAIPTELVESFGTVD